MNLMSQSEGFISEQQTVFVKKRQITDNICAVMMAIEEVRTNQTDGMILALDQENAYDKVRWDWMFSVLRHIGVPEEMVQAIAVSYKSPVVRISINKYLNPNLKFERGVLQGDPLSVLLYIITIQPLLYALKGSGVGLEVSWEGKTVILSSMAHADDLVLFIANELQYKTADTILSRYCSVSDATMHPGKAIAIFAGEKTSEGERRTGWHAKVKTKSTVDTFIHLGISDHLCEQMDNAHGFSYRNILQ
jgi:hypothetical protein